MKTVRLIRSQPASAAENMAVDEALLSSVLRGGPPTLRLYRWRTPSFSAGRFQVVDEVLDRQACAEEGVEIVRRPTGGGALFHHDEVTYAVCCRDEDLSLTGGVQASYRRLCSFLLRFYRSLGIPAEFAQDAGAPEQARSEICAAGREKHDIVVGGRKIGGNAQRRVRAGILQHGAVPRTLNIQLMRRCLRRAPAGLEQATTSLAEQLLAVPSLDEMSAGLVRAFEEAFEVPLAEESLTSEERRTAARLATEKYANLAWSEKRDGAQTFVAP